MNQLRTRGLVDSILDLDMVDLVTRLSLLTVVISLHFDVRAMVIAGVAAVVAFPRGRARRPELWLVGGAVLLVWELTRWETIDNHVWLTTYWVFAVGLSLTTSDPARTLRSNGRLLVGAVFGLATAWKLLSPDYPSGAFFHYSLLFDDRFETVASTIGGLTPADASANAEQLGPLARGEIDVAQVHQGGSRLAAIAAVFTWYGVILEGAIAVAWLATRRNIRHLLLLAFAGTTYLIVPVGGFGCLLMTMGLTQTADDRRWRAAYLVAFGLLLVYGPIWQALSGA